MAYGVTENGFIPKPLSVCRKELTDDIKGKLGSGISTIPESVFGQIIDIVSERESDIWDGMELQWLSNSRSSATGVLLDIASALIGVYRELPTKSVVTTQALIGDYNSNIPAGTIFSVNGNSSSTFETTDDVILDTGADEIQNITFSAIPSVGSFYLSMNGYLSTEITFESTNSDVKSAIESISGITEVTVTGNFTTGFVVQFVNQDSKQPWSLFFVSGSTLQNGSGNVSVSVARSQTGVYQGVVEVIATDFGPDFYAPERSLININTPISGLDYTVNMSVSTIGKNTESDEELRIRGDQSLGIFGYGTPQAIRAAIESIGQEIEYCKVFENDEDTAVNGWDPHSIAVYVHQSGGSSLKDNDIAQSIYDRKAGGIKTNGTETVIIYDSEGYAKDIKFYRAQEVQVYLTIQLSKIQGVYPGDGDETLKSLIVENGNKLGVGSDVVVYPTLMGWISQVAGISNVSILIGTSPSPSSDSNITISDGSNGVAQFSSWDVSRITII